MNDDWRLQVDFHEEGHAHLLMDHLGATELEHDLSGAFHDRLIVSRDGDRVFVYGGSREQVEGARELLLSLAQQHGWKLDSDLKRWHPVAEDWEDPDKPLPDAEARKRVEHEALIATERQEAEERGHPEFEVRIDLQSHHEASHLADKLRQEGLLPVHRWRFVLLGAADEDSANALADRIREEASSGSRVSVEGTWKAAYAERPANPFAIFGGLGG
jgi:hypothetical protein